MKAELILVVFGGTVTINLVCIIVLVFVQTKWLNSVIRSRVLTQIESNLKEWNIFRAEINTFIEEIVRNKTELFKIKEEVEIQRAEFFNDISDAHLDEGFVDRLSFVNGLLPELQEQQMKFCDLSTSLFNLQSIIRNYALQIEQGEAENLQLALKAYQSRIDGDKRQEQLSRYLNGAIKALSPKAAEEISSRIGNVHLISKSDVKHDAVS